MHSEVPSPEFIEQSADPQANAGGIDLNSEMTAKDAAQSSIRRGPRIIGKLLFAWSWFVAGALLLFVAPPVLLIGGLARRQDWIYSWADWGARTWLRLSGVKLKVTGQEHLDPNQTYVFVANHWSYLDAAPLFCGTGRRMGLVAKKELLKAPILGFGMGFVNVIAIDRSNRERAVETLKWEREETLRRNLEKAQKAARCRHKYTNGRQCGAPRVRGRKLCHMHERVEEAKTAIIDLGPMEDADSIQMAIRKLQGAILDGKLNHRQIGQLAYTIQLAAWNVTRTSVMTREK